MSVIVNVSLKNKMYKKNESCNFLSKYFIEYKM